MAEDPRGTEALRVSGMFPPVSTVAWEGAIGRDLKGAPLERLLWSPEPGVAVRPFYRQEDLSGLEAQLAARPGEFPFVREAAAGWEVAQGWTPPPEAIRADALHEAGATAVQELGFAIAEGVDRVAAAADAGRAPAEAIGGMSFVFAVGSTHFLEIAKLRAARLLWAQASAAFGVTDERARMRMHVRTSRANKDVQDGVRNLLRVTTEALSAVIGGCRSLTVEAPGFDPHLAENVHHILREESHMDAVSDPAGGSYYVEALTDTVARRAWALLQEVEGQGGFAAGWESGAIPAALERSRARAVPRSGTPDTAGQDT